MIKLYKYYEKTILYINSYIFRKPYSQERKFIEFIDTQTRFLSRGCLLCMQLCFLTLRGRQNRKESCRMEDVFSVPLWSLSLWLLLVVLYKPLSTCPLLLLPSLVLHMHSPCLSQAKQLPQPVTERRNPFKKEIVKSGEKLQPDSKPHTNSSPLISSYLSNVLLPKYISISNTFFPSHFPKHTFL